MTETDSSTSFRERVKRVQGISAQAREIAVTAHRGQTDKLGQDYIKHPERVADIACQSLEHPANEELLALSKELDGYADCEAFNEELVATAWLHDVIEDTEVTLTDLEYFGMPESVVDAVNVLTKVNGESNEDYYHRVKQNIIARVVKIADMLDNTDPERMMKLPVEVRERLMAKYLKGFRVLQHSSRTEIPVETY